MESEALREVRRRREEREAREEASPSDWALVEEAVAKKQWEVVRWVLRQGRIRNVDRRRGTDRKTLLHEACHGGDLETVKVLCQELAANARLLCTNRLWGVAHFAADGGHLDVLRFLLTEGGVDVEIRDGAQRSLLHVGAHSLPVVRCLVEEFGAEVEVADQDGETPLHHAARGGAVSSLRYLLGRGAHLDAKTVHGEGVLHFAAGAESADALRYLVEECGCDPMEDLWCQATSADSLEALQYLVEECGLSLDVGGKGAVIMLATAVRAGAMAVAEWLVQLGVDPNDADVAGVPPLHHATRFGRLAMVKWLVQQCGVDVEAASSSDGLRAVHWAVRAGHLPELRFLVEEAGADVNTQTLEARGTVTPLHVAADFGEMKYVRYLVEEADADVLLENRDGERPSQVASTRGHEEVAAFLQEAEEMAQMQKNPE